MAGELNLSSNPVVFSTKYLARRQIGPLFRIKQEELRPKI
jgi:hypothetical protein